MGAAAGHLPGGRAAWSRAAALASVGAGSIHAAAATAHAGHAPAQALFVALAVSQIGWGVLALGRVGWRFILAGAFGNLVAIGGWLTAKTVGIGVVDGLEHAEPAQLADGLAVGLAALAVGCAVTACAGARRVAARLAPGPAPSGLLALAIVGAALAGVTAAPGHTHRGDDHVAGETDLATARAASAHHDARDRASRATPRRLARTIDLGGVDGVTARQQARAERLVAATRRRLPRFADIGAARAAGYVSIGDAMTGYEHYVKWSAVNDDRILDPRRAESLVYRVDGDDRTLVAAMYMLREGATLDTVPDVGGRLTQWHVHDDLCFTDDRAPIVAGLTTPGGECAAARQARTGSDAARLDRPARVRTVRGARGDRRRSGGRRRDAALPPPARSALTSAGSLRSRFAGRAAAAAPCRAEAGARQWSTFRRDGARSRVPVPRTRRVRERRGKPASVSPPSDGQSRAARVA